MTRIIFLCIYMLLASTVSKANLQTDSLTLVSKNQKGEKLLSTMLKLTEEFSYESDGDTTIYYAKKTFVLAKKYKDTYALVSSQLFISAGYFSKKEYEQSREVVLSALNMASIKNYPKRHVMLLYMIARCYQKELKYEQAIDWYKKMYEVSSKLAIEASSDNQARAYCKGGLQQLSYTYYYAGKSDEGISYFKSIEKKAKTLPKDVERSVYSNTSFLMLQGQDYQAAEKYLLGALAISEKEGSLDDKYQDNAYLGSNYENSKRSLLAIKYFRKALEIAQEQKSDLKIAWIMMSLSKSYESIGNLKDCFGMRFGSMKLYKKINDSIGMAYVHNQIGSLFSRWHNFKDAELHLKTAEGIYTRQHRVDNMGAAHINLASLYAKQKKYDLLQYHVDEVEKIINKTHSNHQTSQFYYWKGILALEKDNDVKAAIDWFNKIGAMLHKYQYNGVLVLGNFSLAKAYMRLGDENKALACSVKAYAFMESLKDVYQKKLIAEQLSGIYDNKQQSDSAFKYLKVSKYINDKIFKQENTIALYQNERDFRLSEAKDEKQALLKEKKNLFQVLHKNRLGFIIAATIAFLLVLSIYLYRNIRFKRVIEVKEEEKNQVANRFVESETKLSDAQNEISDQNLIINKLNEDLRSKMDENGVTVSDDIGVLLNSNLATDDEWASFLKTFNKVLPGFFYNMRIKYPKLTQNEERIFALLKLNLSTQDMSQILAVSKASVNTARYRLRKKLGLSQDEKLEDIVNMF
ncbi:tetratricopeptide repeat protein [Ancylomarina sp. YFZ004]